MKKKQIILGLTATLFAVGGAFASIRMNSSSQVAHYMEIEGNKETCTQWEELADCAPSPTQNCEEFITQDGLNQNRDLYEDPGCEQPLNREAGF